MLDASGLISKLGIKNPWNEIPLLSDILFQEYKIWYK